MGMIILDRSRNVRTPPFTQSMIFPLHEKVHDDFGYTYFQHFGNSYFIKPPFKNGSRNKIKTRCNPVDLYKITVTLV